MAAINQPVLETERLVLRPFRLADAPEVERLAGDRAIADTTLAIPHPYTKGMGRVWISSHPGYRENGSGAIFAVTLKPEGSLVGAVGLSSVSEAFSRAEIGYWVGKPYWNKGYATEATRTVLRFAFRNLGLNRVHASHFTRNPASGRVMQKLGMTREGMSRQHVRRWDRFEDLVQYGILASEFEP